MHTHTHMHKHMHTHVHTHAHAHACTHAHAHTHMHKHMHTHVHAHAHAHARTHAHAHAHTCTHMHTERRTQTENTHAHTHTHIERERERTRVCRGGKVLSWSKNGGGLFARLACKTCQRTKVQVPFHWRQSGSTIPMVARTKRDCGVRSIASRQKGHVSEGRNSPVFWTSATCRSSYMRDTPRAPGDFGAWSCITRSKHH